MHIWQRIRDFYTGVKTRSAIADRECKHDGSKPECMDCTRAAVGW